MRRVGGRLESLEDRDDDPGRVCVTTWDSYG